MDKNSCWGCFSVLYIPEEISAIEDFVDVTLLADEKLGHSFADFKAEKYVTKYDL